MLCTELSLVKEFRNKIDIEPLRCRRWTCEICAPMRKRRLIREAAHGEPTTFITLTSNPHWFESPDERARELKKAWTEVRRLAKKKYNYKSLPFLAVFEKTKRGEPHLHICLRARWIDRDWLSAEMAKRNGAWNVDIKRIWDPKRAAGYVGKYIGKDPQPFQGCKRYWRSLDYLDTATRRQWQDGKPECTITIARDRPDYVAAPYRKVGYVIPTSPDYSTFTVFPFAVMRGGP